MILSTSTNILSCDLGKGYQVPIETAIKECARAGYQDIDLNLCAFCRADQALARDDWEHWVDGIGRLGEKLHVKFSQAHAYWILGNVLNADMSGEDGEWGEELMRRSVIAAQRLGVKWMVVHPYSVLHESWYDYRKSFSWNREYYKKWGDFYADHQVGMAIENMNKPIRYCSCADELLELIDAINNPMVQACIDTGHAHMAGINVSQMIRRIGGHLKATHIADNHANTDEHFAPFNGTIDWAEVMRALRDIGYEECFAFEIQHLSSMYPKETQRYLVNFSYDLGQYLMKL